MFRPARETALPAAGLCARSRGIAEGRPCSFLRGRPAWPGAGNADTQSVSGLGESASKRRFAGVPAARMPTGPGGQDSPPKARSTAEPTACRQATAQQEGGGGKAGAFCLQGRPCAGGEGQRRPKRFCCPLEASKERMRRQRRQLPASGQGAGAAGMQASSRRELTGRASTAGQGPGFPRARRGAHGCRLRQSGRRP